ncbi:MAG: FKBP12-associated protein [Candelina mexicana]|nr:MAG: FKBP12-associated protein [Candelina mexicana]
MATVAPPPQTPNDATDRPPRQRQRWRRPRQGDVQGASQTNGVALDHLQGGGSGAQPSGDALLAMRPASVAPRSQPQSTEPSSAEVSAAENGAPSGHRNPRGRRGGQERQRGGAIVLETSDTRQDRGQRRTRGGGTRINIGRQFGGQLTANEIETPSSPSTVLQADAPEFHPGRQHQQRPAVNGTLKALAQAPNRNVGRNQRARRDSKSSAPDIATRIHEDITHGLYECPICTSEVGRKSQVWSCKTCWTVFHLSCIKKWSKNEGSTHAQQQTADGELPPPRQWRCPGCNLPKEIMPATYSCWCEKEIDPRPISGIHPHSCGQTCEKPILCCDRGDEKESKRASYDGTGVKVIKGWTGMFDCGGCCGRDFDCGKHNCEKPCHVQEAEPEHCPRSPDVVSRCPCGKTPLEEITDKQRQTCEDPIPNCKKEFVILANVLLVSEQSRSLVAVAGQPHPPSVTKVPKNLLSVPEHVESLSTVAATSAASAAVPENVKPQNVSLPSVSFGHWDPHLVLLMRVLRLNTFVLAPVDVCSSAAIILVLSSATKALAVPAEKLSLTS